MKKCSYYSERALESALALFLGFGAAIQVQANEPATAPAISALEVPHELGRISQRLPATGSSTKETRLVVIIQDAHGNYTAQKSMAGILDYLAEHYGLKLIFMEGAEGNASLEYLRHTGPLSVRKQTAENYLKAGLISGEEYIDTVSDHDWVVWGAEDLELYEKNFNAMLESEALKPQIEPQLKMIQEAIRELKNRHYGLQLKELESRKLAYASGEFKLGGYLKYLVDQNTALGLSLDAYPNIALMVEPQAPVSAEKFKEEIQVFALLKEIRTLERSVIEHTAQTPQENQLLSIQEGLSAYTKALAREWTSDDYRAFQEHHDSWQFSIWLAQIRELALANGIAFDWHGDPTALDQSLQDVIRFYDATLERDAAILRNVQEKMGSEGRALSALVVGGFHSENIAQLLIQNGLNVAILTPVVGNDDPSINYLEVMKYKYQDYQHKNRPRSAGELWDEDAAE